MYLVLLWLMLNPACHTGSVTHTKNCHHDGKHNSNIMVKKPKCDYIIIINY